MLGRIKPSVSILCPSYNHQDYVSGFIDSVLAQTDKNWELIIVDDCSTDDNVARIMGCSDRRIRLFRHDFNRGINAAINTAFSHARSDIVCLMASDDMLAPDYVQTICETFAQHPDADVVYPALQCIKPSGQIIENEIWYQLQRPQAVLLRDMFFIGNRIMSPGMAVRKSAFARIYPLEIPLSQYQDYKTHIRLLLHGKCVQLPRPLVLYRIPSKKSGISATGARTSRQQNLEEGRLMDAFLDIKTVVQLHKIFGDLLAPYKEVLADDTIPFVLGHLALDCDSVYKRHWGYDQIANFISSPKNYERVNRMCGFCYRDFLALADRFDVKKS